MIVGIIGGGASGMAAALRAAENPACRDVWSEVSICSIITHSSRCRESMRTLYCRRCAVRRSRARTCIWRRRTGSKEHIEIIFGICYNAIRRKDKSVQSGTKTNPSGAGTPEGFYSIWARWLKPLADYLTMSVQPLAYVIGDYTCHDGHKKRQKYIQNGTPPFLHLSRGGSCISIS